MPHYIHTSFVRSSYITRFQQDMKAWPHYFQHKLKQAMAISAPTFKSHFHLHLLNTLYAFRILRWYQYVLRYVCALCELTRWHVYSLYVCIRSGKKEQEGCKNWSFTSRTSRKQQSFEARYPTHTDMYMHMYMRGLSEDSYNSIVRESRMA